MRQLKTALLSGVTLVSMLVCPTVFAYTINVNAAGTATITLTNDSESLNLSGTEGNINYEIVSDGSDDGFVLLGDEGSDVEIGALTGVKNVVVNARGGFNSVTVGFLSLQGYLTVRSGNSRDDIIIAFSEIGGNLNVITGGDDDVVNILLASVAGTSTISTSGGDDEVFIEQFLGEKRLRVVTGSGNDLVNLGLQELFFELDGDMPVIPSGGDLIDPGSDVLSLEFGSAVSINTGAHDDAIFVSGASIEGQTSLVSGAGYDFISVVGNAFEGSVSVNAGAQNDDVTAIQNTFYSAATFKGASGNADIYRDNETNNFMSRSVNISFEQFFEIGTMMPGPCEVEWVESEWDVCNMPY